MSFAPETSSWLKTRLSDSSSSSQQRVLAVRPPGDGQSWKKFGAEFDRVAKGAGIRVLKTAVKAPLMNSTCERFLGSVRRECLDHVIILGELHLQTVLREYVDYFNAARPHQGLDQAIPVSGGQETSASAGEVFALPVLGGLHHDYRRAA